MRKLLQEFLKGIITVNVMIEAPSTVPYVELELAFEQAGYERGILGSTLMVRKGGGYRPLRPGELDRFIQAYFIEHRIAHRWRGDLSKSFYEWLLAGSDALPSNTVARSTDACTKELLR
jgi:hypothetical protein